MPSRYPGITLTESLSPGGENLALRRLQEYFAPPPEGKGYTGRHFDTWDPSGTAAESADTFTADDLIAVTFLSVSVPAHAAIGILGDQRDDLSELLRQIGADRDLVDIDEPFDADAPAERLNRALRRFDGVGPTVASKLMARKLPRLIPIYDSVINEHVLGGSGEQWEPLRQALRADQRALHRHLLELHQEAGLDERISALRVFDVLAWMDGKAAAGR
ncbi:hypothetical protein FB554_2395 [Barrientosiimonas humi]|uniref:Uncharacterized protein n=1 Tax=Barrientosiimonas humi TaxID=999931 RepID=A0A542XEI0_9MICO|nr:DUF6308 family protein [Barrientosiimonas humi]TQL34232.1 hypothetical protein FB554_2395 [Barrientosiimonas humi]CAG7574224.1 hypothetical protein BH39T_PBIAJDOK_02867 [Barrientosiimonas humi]